MPHSVCRRFLFGATLFTSLSGAALAAVPPAPTPLVRGIVSDAITTPLVRDLPGGLKTSRDMGLVNPNLIVPHAHLALARPPASQAAFDKLALDQTTRGTADYHKWITPAQLRSYGPAQSDINAVVLWLTRQGLKVNSVSPSGMSIDFGGSVGRISTAFHTQIHNVQRAGEAHVANVTPPAIPAALAPAVTGVTLSSFFPKPALHKVTPNLTQPTPYGTYYAVTPKDLAKIYNIAPVQVPNPLYGEPILGTGVTVALVEQTQILSADWYTFRHHFDIGTYPGTLAQTHPNNCPSPGFTGDETEAAIDVEWASAAAPGAHIIEASCAGSAPFDFGVFDTLANLVEHPTPATIFSISYGGDEALNGFAFIAAWTNLVEEGAAEGKSIFVSTGDSGTSVVEGGYDSLGLFVNGLSDTPYNTAVGGTDFYDGALKQYSKYWTSSNGPGGESALSYIPEIPWDNSCASPIIAKYVGLTPMQACNGSVSGLQNGVGGSGSQSVYYSKPAWQVAPGVPNDGVRDQPDVSLFASNGEWGHFYLECMSDPNEGGVPCDFSVANGDFFASAYGGTSFAAPEFAGIAALIAETYGGAPIGNIAPVLYAIGKAQLNTPLGRSTCDSTLGNKIGANCVFQYVTAGSNAEPCYAGSASCYTDATSTEGIGILEAPIAGKEVFAYPTGTGYSLATGLGTVNVTNLLINYNTAL